MALSSETETQPETQTQKQSPATVDKFSTLKRYRIDIIGVSCLALLAAALTYFRFQSLDPVIYTDFTEDVWFGSDIERVIGNISDRSLSFRAGVHPLFPLLVYPFVRGIQAVLGTDTVSAIQGVIAIAAAVWLSLLATIFRLIGCPRVDTVLYSLLILFSAGVLFWTTVPESYLLGSLSMVVPMFVVVLSRYVHVPAYGYILASAFSLSITTTNWMAGLFATFVGYPWKRALIIVLQTFAFVGGLWIVQKQLFPLADFFLASDVFQEELKYVSPQSSGGPIRVIAGLLFHPMVMPSILTIPSNRGLAEWPLLSVQLSAPGSGGILGAIAAIIWGGLLLIGGWALFSKRVDPKLRLFFLLMVAGQFALHLVYGEETFLYALHILPFLMLTVAFTSLTRLRMVSLALVSALILLVAANNSMQFGYASDFLKQEGPLRQQIESAEVSLENSPCWHRFA